MATTAIDTENRTLRIVRDFRASAERVFDAFTKPELAQQWWGPEGLSTPEIELNVFEGGSWRTVMTNSDGSKYTVEGVYKVVERPVRLVYTWSWVDDGVTGAETTVDLSFSPIEGGTRLSLVQSVFEGQAMRDDHVGGWNSSFDCLEKYLSQSQS